jgi:hypothetical protein
MGAVSSSAHSQTASLPQSTYSDYEIGAFENFHQPVEDTLIVLGPRLKVFLQYVLCLRDALKSQLLIGHCFYSSNKMPRTSGREKINPTFRNIPAILGRILSIFVSTLPK